MQLQFEFSHEKGGPKRSRLFSMNMALLILENYAILILSFLQTKLFHVGLNL
jgi:hypothetical protein